MEPKMQFFYEPYQKQTPNIQPNYMNFEED